MRVNRLRSVVTHPMDARDETIAGSTAAIDTPPVAAAEHPQQAQPAFVLHSYPFKETSLVVELLTRGFGRIAVVAKGARRPKSSLRGVLMAFQPLLVAWSGKGELHTLVRAEWEGRYRPLKGLSLICGFYVNELLLKLTARHDPHERLFDTVRAHARCAGGRERARSGLADVREEPPARVGLRGHARARCRERLPHRRGAALHLRARARARSSARDDASANGVELLGQTLLDMQADVYSSTVTQQQSKVLMRTLINHYLGDQVLHTRQLLRDLQEL